MTPDAARVLRVLRETGPAKLTVVGGIVGPKGCYVESIVQRVVGELFILGVVEWRGAKRGRMLAARTVRR